MKAVQSVLVKTLVKEFYRINAGFFLITVGICFGFLSGTDHYIIATFFTSSPAGLAIPIAIAVLYAAKVGVFNTIAFARKENVFLHETVLIKNISLYFHFLCTSLLQMAPILLYSIFLMFVSLRINALSSLVVVLISQLIITSCVVVYLVFKMKRFDPGIKIGILSRKLNASISRPYLLFYPEWISKNQPIMILGTKILACTLLIGISRLYLFDTYDERLYAMGAALIFSFNMAIVFYYHRFENFHFALVRGLPIPMAKRMLLFCLSWTMLVLPEIGTIINNCPSEINWLNQVAIILFGLSTGMMGYAFLFIRDCTLESFLQKVFVISFLWIILILFKVPIALLIPIHIGLALFLFRKYFYRFEFNAEINSER